MTELPQVHELVQPAYPRRISSDLRFQQYSLGRMKVRLGRKLRPGPLSESPASEDQPVPVLLEAYGSTQNFGQARILLNGSILLQRMNEDLGTMRKGPHSRFGRPPLS